MKEERERDSACERMRERGREIARLKWDKHMILALSTKCAWKWPTQTWSCFV